MAKVLLKNISKRYREQTAVEGFNLEVNDNELVVIVGPSGCGKSTLLRMIAGITELSEGEICIDDVLVNDFEPKDRNIAMVFQNYALYPNKTVYENLEFGLKMRKVDKSTIREKVISIAKMLGIDGYLDRKPAKLSGGEKQRVAIGRALVRDPKVFLMDEPLSNLDAKLRNTMRAEILKLHRQLKATMLYVTHDQIEAMTLGDRIVVMNKGKIQQVDTPDSIIERPANKFVAQFMGVPPMNFLEAEIVCRDGVFYAEIEDTNEILMLPQDLKVSAERQKVSVGIRPEHIQIVEQLQECNSLTVKLDIVERMVSEMHMHVFAGQNSLTIKTDRQKAIDGCGDMKVYLPPSNLHVFDNYSEKNLRL